MKLEIIRKEFTIYSTIGDLLINSEPYCFTLEDVVREEKIPGETAIPYGTYEVIIDYSSRFKKLMPLIKNVLGFSGVRIHPGNDKDDTEGCILIGYTKAVDFVGNSKKAFDKFFLLLEEGLKTGKVILTITEGK